VGTGKIFFPSQKSVRSYLALACRDYSTVYMKNKEFKLKVRKVQLEANDTLAEVRK
jgi:hypothetical protein